MFIILAKHRHDNVIYHVTNANSLSEAQDIIKEEEESDSDQNIWEYKTVDFEEGKVY